MRQQAFASPTEALEHHGVKGQKWGVRKEEDTSGQNSAQPVMSEKRQRRVEKFQKQSDVMSAKISELKRSNEALQGTRDPIKLYSRYVNTQDIKVLDRSQKQAVRNVESAKQGKLTSTQKKVIIGAVATTAILGGVVVATRGTQSGAFNSVALRGSAFIRGEKVPFNVNKELTGKMSASDLLSKVVKPVNPGYSTPGGHMNCRRSTFAYELRRRGFDVHATTSSAGWGQSESGVINAVTPGSRNFYRSLSLSQTVAEEGRSTVARGDIRKNPITKLVLDNLDLGGPDGMTPGFGSKKVFDTLTKQPEGARGEVMFKFEQFGHSMAYEIVDGVPHIFDSQKGTFHDLTKTVEEKWGTFHGAEITRLDNADLDLSFLTRWADNN